VSDRHYSPSDYQNLSQDQRSALRSLRKARDDDKKDTKIAALERQIAGVEKDAEPQSDDDEETVVAGNSNRNHKALKKPKRKE
jgi:hypothetical protein